MKKKNYNVNIDATLGKILNSSFFKHQRLQDQFHIKWMDQKYWEWIVEKYDLFLDSSIKNEIVPRTIHQIWLGSKVPKKYDIWRNSWIKYNPDFEYILWDEKKILETGLINEKQFMQAKNYGVKSDIARYEILYKFGGIYADTDFEALKPIDPRLLSRSFVAGHLFEYKPQINNALIISEPKCGIIKTVIHNLPEYPGEMTGLEVLDYSGANYLSKIIFENRYLEDILVLPSQYLYPWPSFMKLSNQNPHSMATEITIGIHHWDASWMKKSLLLRLLNKIKKITLNK